MIDLSNFKAFADLNLNGAKIAKFVFDRVENIQEKGENVGYHHSLLFPQCFKTFTFLRVIKSRDCAVKG